MSFDRAGGMEPSSSPHCEMDSTASLAPLWLDNFLSSPYFNPCPSHASLHRSERNLFCTDCNTSSLCSVCVQREHSGHALLQVRKSSYHDAVRVSDVAKLLDLTSIQAYVINGAKIVFLRGRPQAKPMKGAPYHCETCHRALLDACRFCSIGCKLAAAPQDYTLSLLPGGLGARRPLGGEPSSLALSDEESAESGHRLAGGALGVSGSGREAQHKGGRHRVQVPSRLPVLVLEDHDDASSGDSFQYRFRKDDGAARSKRRRMLEGDEVTSGFPPLVDMLMQPGTPPLSAACPTWRTHKRKGVPHRSPLA